MRKAAFLFAANMKLGLVTCLYQKGYKPLLINCEAVIWL